jgi:hypothetical protein
MISEALTSVLRSGRVEFNRQFAEARRLYPDLDGGALSEFLASRVDGVVRAVGQVQPDRVADVVMATYEIGLELVGQKLVGPGARNPIVEEGWPRVLLSVKPLVAAAPTRILGAVSNALHNLASTPGARPEQWIETLERLGPKCPDSDTFLRLGQVAAWKAGLAHFRAGAIAAADALPPPLALAALGAPEKSGWPEIRQGLLSSPWFDPAQPAPIGNGPANHLRVMAQAGAFRGFGGLFAEPPQVSQAGEHFLACSGEEGWLLTADLYGATFHRASPGEFESARQQVRFPSNLRIMNAKVTWQDERFEIPSLGQYTSAAANETTLALTSELTHSIVLVALK